MDKIKKFLRKIGKKQRKSLEKIILDIYSLNLECYDIKAMKGLKGLYRLRKGQFRIIFSKNKGQGVIYNIDFRENVH